MSMIDNFHFLEAIPCPAAGDTFAGDVHSDVINMEHAKEVVFIVYRGAGGSGTSTITVESCDDVTPSTATAIAFEYKLITSGTSAHTEGAWTASGTGGFATAATANVIYLVRVNADDLSGSDNFVRLGSEESDNNPVGGAVVACLSGYRYPQEQKLSAIA